MFSENLFPDRLDTKKAPFGVLFSNEVCLAAHEVMLRIVKLLRGEVSLDMKKAPFGVLFSMIYASRMKRR